MDLLNKKCVPCEGGAAAMGEVEAQKYMAEVMKWDLVAGGKKIEKNFKFKDFTAALKFVNQVGELAEQEGHHPDINLYNWNQVKLTLSTHAIGGLSENDFILAAKVDQLVTRAG